MYTPVRQGKSMRYGNNRWKGYSAKIGRDVFFESSLEYDHWVLIETNIDIVNFCEQPKEITSIYNGKNHRSTFDMWVKYSDQSEEFIEVKYSTELTTSSKKYDENSKQIFVQRDWCERNGFKYTVETDLKIRSNPIYLENLKVILPHIRLFSNVDTSLKIRILNNIFNGANCLEDIFLLYPKNSKSELIVIIYSLLYERAVLANIEEYRIGKETRFYYNEAKKGEADN